MDWNCDGDISSLIISFQCLPTLYLPILPGQCHLGHDRNIVEREQFDRSKCGVDHYLYCWNDIWVKELKLNNIFNILF